MLVIYREKMANYGFWTKVPGLIAICVIITTHGRPSDLDSDGIGNSISVILGGVNNPSDFGQRNPAHFETQKGRIIVQQCVCPGKLNGCLCKKEISGGIANLPSYGFVHSTKDFNSEMDRGSNDGVRAKKDTNNLSAAQQFINGLNADNVIRIIYDALPEELREQFRNDIYNRFIEMSRLSI